MLFSLNPGNATTNVPCVVRQCERMPGTFGLTLAAFFFIIIPGVVGVKYFLRSYVRLDSLTRIDKLVFSGIAGSLILLLFLIYTTLFCSTLTVMNGGWSNVFTPAGTCGGLTNSSFSDFADLPAIVVLLVAAFETASAGLLGHYFGDFYNRKEPGATREPKYIEQPWEFASKKLIREETKATVITSDGDRIRGTVHRLGAPSENSNLLLKDPVRTVYDSDEGEVREEGDIAPYSYHHHLDISQVYFDSLEEGDDLEAEDGDGQIRDEEGQFVPHSFDGEDGPDEITFRILTEDDEQSSLSDLENDEESSAGDDDSTSETGNQ